jgi:arylsulfatase
MTQQQANRPNIVVILVDDLGFSDIGCYGSEIRTPNIDALAGNGLRFTQMYNAAKCCRSRAAPLTGLNPHQAGIGHMTDNYGSPNYQGYLNNNCATIAEMLRAGGYRTLMSGKWHVGSDYSDPDTSSWPIGDPEHPVPTQRGFDRFFGLLGGAGSFFNPPGLMLDDNFVEVDSPEFYFTDAIADHGAQMIDESVAMSKPFFLYTSFTAPHCPLHAPEEDVARYEGSYRKGWDEVRTSRHEELLGNGILDPKWKISSRPRYISPWENAEHKDWEDLRMAVYAAQVDRMDQGVGRIMAKIRELGIDDNTLVMFVSDNGGCASDFKENPTGAKQLLYAQTPTVDGKTVRYGNNPAIRPGPADTHQSYDVQWANASNSPFRLYKNWTHEGGISTPFVIHWPDKIERSAIVTEPAYIHDITATCLEAAGVAYPTEMKGNPIPPIEGESFMGLIEGGPWSREKPIIIEHEGNRAVRDGEWKLVGEYGGDWELYNMTEDRTELNDLSERNPELVESIAKQYGEWAERNGVLPWPVDPSVVGTAENWRRSWGVEME